MGRKEGPGKVEAAGETCDCGGDIRDSCGLPNLIWRDQKTSMIDSRWSNHNEVQSMTEVKRFRREWIAVDPLHTIVLGVSRHQTVVQSKTALALS